MWTSHRAAQDASEYPPWMDGGGMDYSGSPSSGYAGGASSMTSFPSTPMTPSPGFGDAAAANHLASLMKAQVQALSSRVQKLERSRGQITKDINDMLAEAREMQKLVGIEPIQPLSKKVGPVSPGLVADAEDQGDEPVARRGTRTVTAPASAMPRILEEDQPASSQPHVLKKAHTEKITPPPGLSMPPPESLTVTKKEVDGKEVPRVEWRIDNVKVKFKDCVGRPLVSPPFEAGGLTDCRLMVLPNLGIDTTGLSMREQKAKYEARINDGPLSGTLKFKVVTCEAEHLPVKFSLYVGTESKGPLDHDFAEHIIHGLEFSNNWLDQLQGSSLVVGVDVLEVGQLQTGSNGAKA